MKKAYPKYSKTRIPWLQLMPDHWDDVKVKFLFKERVEKGFPEEPLLAATQTQGVVPKELYENRTVTAQKDFHLLKLVKVGDFVISLRSFQGGIEYAYYRGIISPAYTVMKPLPEVFGGYFKYLFKSKHFIDDLTTYVTGIREGQNIDYSEFRDSFQPFPPLPEQRQIAAFLDHKCALIDTFIQKKTRLIELLKEQKQAIINKAVTKGLDPNVRLKPSGIDWLGDIPEHWEVKKLKYLVTKVGSGITPSGGATVYVSEGIPLLRSQNIYSDRFELSEVAFITPDIHDSMSNSKVKNGDVLLNITGGSLGRCYYVSGQFIEANVNQHVCIIRPNRKVKTEFIHLLMVSELGQVQIWKEQTGSGREGLNFEAIKNFSFPLSIEAEQKEIIEYIEKEKEIIDHTIIRIEREITLLQEYKTTLIAEAVTGKIDVRDWKPKERSLPIETSKGATP